jgi:signal transduction histidine kinase
MHESYLEAFLEISRQLAENRALEPLLEYIMEAVPKLFGAECGHLVLLGHDGVVLRYLISTPDGRIFSECIDPFLQRILDRITQAKPALRITPGTALAKDLSVSSYHQIWIPLGDPGPAIGTLGLERSGEADPFTEKDGQFLELLALQVTMAIRNAMLYEELTDRTATYTASMRVYNEEFYAFCRRIAHDIRSPLTTIVGFTRLLEKKGELDERQKGQLAAIKHSAGVMDNIIAEFRLLAGIRVSEFTIELLDMDGIVAEVLQRLAHRIEEYEAEIILPNRWPLVCGYTPWVAEVWVNLVSNALKYGGRPPHVEIGAKVQSDDKVRFWVHDNGEGISSEAQAEMFPAEIDFSEVGARGDGLGLSVVRHIVETLGGQVAVESQAGQGSTFSFTLPRVTG